MKPTANEIVVRACRSMRIDCEKNSRTVFAPDAESATDAVKAIIDSGRAGAGREGHEYLRAIGLIQHVFAMRVGCLTVRIVSPAFHPRGLFSNLRSLERRIKP